MVDMANSGTQAELNEELTMSKEATSGADTVHSSNDTSKIQRGTDWPSVLFYIHLHLAATYALYKIYFEAYYSTSLFALFVGVVSMLGVTAGAHRLWAHRSYMASRSLRFFLATCFTITGQGTIYDWVLNHRIHHKHFGTENDPHNYKQGLYFAHFGCQMVKSNSNLTELAKDIDMSDIEQDAIVMWQKRLYWLAMPVLCFLLPINVGVEYWGESIFTSLLVIGILRYTIVMHMTWLVNSAFVIWGVYPDDKIKDSLFLFFLEKNYWPQYHYKFPWDYNTTEHGSYGCGCTTSFIRVWEAMGWAHGLRTVDSKAVKRAIDTTLETGSTFVQSLTEEGIKKANKNLKKHNR